MATHAQKLVWWSQYRCDVSNLVSLNLNGRFPVRVASQAEQAALALEEAILDVGYRTPMGATGSYMCRTIGGTTTMSLHAYGIAIDWDYGQNPHLHEPIPRGFVSDPRFTLNEAHIDAVEAIRNTRGESIWKWLGWTIGDTMHFEIDVPPDRCQPATQEGDTMTMTDEEWYDTLRDIDKRKLATLGVITQDELQYFLQPDIDPADKTNLRRAYQVRFPIWKG